MPRMIPVQDFLNRYGYEMVAPVTGDASLRRYARVKKGAHSAILMDAGLEPVDRPGMAEFIKIAEFLRASGVNAPEIYETDMSEKRLIMQDFGSVSFGQALSAGLADADALYNTAADVLSLLRAIAPPEALGLPAYQDTRVHARHEDVLRWWWPYSGGEHPASMPDATVLTAYHAAWRAVESSLISRDSCFVHMDFHLENLMFIPDAQGIMRCGLIDFQDASAGHGAYDIGNLLQNARLSVPSHIQARLLSGFDADFMAHYRVLATQFHCRVIGLFTKFAVQDNRPEYAVHIPRLAGYIDAALQEDVLSPVRRFFNEIGVDFAAAKGLNVRSV